MCCFKWGRSAAKQLQLDNLLVNPHLLNAPFVWRASTSTQTTTTVAHVRLGSTVLVGVQTLSLAQWGHTTLAMQLAVLNLVLIVQSVTQV